MPALRRFRRILRLAHHVEFVDAASACFWHVDGVLARLELPCRTLPQDASLMVELHDACGHGAVDLQEQLAALLPERELVCNPAGTYGGGAAGRIDRT